MKAIAIKPQISQPATQAIRTIRKVFIDWSVCCPNYMQRHANEAHANGSYSVSNTLQRIAKATGYKLVIASRNLPFARRYKQVK
jgi:hypothetical protein